MALTSGCAVFTPPIEKPVIEDSVGMTGTLATTADRRLVLVNKKTGEFVAEPSPDAYTEIASLTKLAASADIAGKGKGNVEFARILATSFQRLGRRSQGVTFFRDGTYRIAEARANKWINQAQYVRLLQDLAKCSKFLIEKELEGNPTLSNIEFSASQVKERIAQLQKILGDLEKSPE